MPEAKTRPSRIMASPFSFSNRISTGGISARGAAPAPQEGDNLEGDEWLKKQREQAQASAAASGPVRPAPPASAGAPRNDVAPPARPTVAQEGSATFAPSSSGRAGDTVGSFQERPMTRGGTISEGYRREIRGDGRTAIYAPGNRFLGYEGASAGSSVPSAGQTNLPSVYEISPQAQAREDKAVAGVAAGNDRLATIRDKVASGAVTVSYGGDGPAKRQALLDQAKKTREQGKADLAGAGSGNGVWRTADGGVVMTGKPDQMPDGYLSNGLPAQGYQGSKLATATNDQVASAFKKSPGMTDPSFIPGFRAPGAPAALASAAPAPSLPAAGGETAPAPAAPASPVKPAVPARPAVTPATKPGPVSPFRAPEGSFLNQTMANVDDTIPGAVRASNAAEAKRNKERLDLATSGPGGSANSRSIIPGVNAPNFVNPVNAKPGESSYRSNEQIVREGPELAAVQAAQSARQWTKRQEQEKSAQADPGSYQNKMNEGALMMRAEKEARRERDEARSKGQPVNGTFREAVRAKFEEMKNSAKK